MFHFLLRCQRFVLYSHNLCAQLGQQFLPFRLACYVSRANHHVMDRPSTPLVVNALRAILNPTENWTSVITLTPRNMLGPSPHWWLLLSSWMYEVGSHTLLIGLPLRSDCDMETPLYITNGSHVNHHPHPLFAPRHVPLTHEGMRVLYANPPFMYPQLVPQSNPHGSGSPLAPRKYRPLCPWKSNPQQRIPSLAIIPPTKIICGCYNMRDSRADLVAKTALIS